MAKVSDLRRLTNNVKSGKARKAVTLLSISRQPKRGEIWIVDFDPAKGAEIEKPRRAVVIEFICRDHRPKRGYMVNAFACKGPQEGENCRAKPCRGQIAAAAAAALQ